MLDYIAQKLKDINLSVRDFDDVAIDYETLFLDDNIDRVYIDLPKPEPIETFNGYIIKQFLEYNGYTNIDYIQGYCYKNNRKLKIGKLLQKLGEKIYYKMFESDLERNNTTQTYDCMVISRYIIDILNMSTNRRWTSCTDLNRDPKLIESQMKTYLEDGGVVVYGINKNDKDITNPYFRKWFSSDFLFHHSEYFGEVNISTMRYIDKFMHKALVESNGGQDYLNGEKPWHTTFHSNYLSTVLRSFMHDDSTYINSVEMEMSIINDLILDSYDYFARDSKYIQALGIELKSIFDIHFFEDRIKSLGDIIKKYNKLNSDSKKVEDKEIDQDIYDKIKYHFVGSTMMGLEKAYDDSVLYWWLEPEHIRYAKDPEEIKDELLAQAC